MGPTGLKKLGCKNFKFNYFFGGLVICYHTVVFLQHFYFTTPQDFFFEKNLFSHIEKFFLKKRDPKVSIKRGSEPLIC